MLLMSFGIPLPPNRSGVFDISDGFMLTEGLPNSSGKK